ALEPARHDRAPVEDERRQVQAQHCHRRPGDGLVTADQADDRVEQMTSADELDAVRDQFAADQRSLHSLGAHRHAVADRDGVELHRRGAGGADALLHFLGEPAQMEVARHRLGPGVGDTDDRFLQVLVGETDPFQHRARGGPVGAFGDDAALVSRVHQSPFAFNASRTAIPTSRVLAADPFFARSAVSTPRSTAAETAPSTASASSCRPSERRNSIAAARIVPNGFATPFPAMSGAEPWIGSYRPRLPSPSDALGSMPIDPAIIAASSLRMSPNMFSVTMTSNCAGLRTSCIAQESTSWWVSCRSGNSSRTTRPA